MLDYRRKQTLEIPYWKTSPLGVGFKSHSVIIAFLDLVLRLNPENLNRVLNLTPHTKFEKVNSIKFCSFQAQNSRKTQELSRMLAAYLIQQVDFNRL